MSQAGRQDFGDKVHNAVKPDSEKSTTEHVGDMFKGKSDSAASTLQPQSDKSTAQKVGDTVSGNQNHNDQSLLDKAKGAVGLGPNQGHAT